MTAKVIVVKKKVLALRQRESSQSLIRNVCIIAHVDHGKTTLSDALLHRAVSDDDEVLSSPLTWSQGLLAQHKAGKACALDTDAQEQARGITIKSTAISLVYPLRVSAAQAAVFGPPVEPESIYVGNLPFTLDIAELCRILCIPKTCISTFKPKRGFAFVEVPPEVAGRLLSSGATALGRELRLERRGDGSIVSLLQQCRELGIAPPSFIRIEKDDSSPDVIEFAVALVTADKYVAIQQGSAAAPPGPADASHHPPSQFSRCNWIFYFLFVCAFVLDL